MLVNYDTSDASDEDNPKSLGEIKTLSGVTCLSQPEKVTLKDRFRKLKEKRKVLSDEYKSESVTPQCKVAKGDNNGRTKEEKQKLPKRKRCYKDGLESYMGYSFKVLNEYEPHTAVTSKLDEEISEAIKEKRYDDAEKMNSQIIQETLSEEMKSALQAKQYLQEKKKIEMNKQKKKKLKWNFAHKQRWETKGNM